MTPKHKPDISQSYFALFSTPLGQAVLEDLERVHRNRSSAVDMSTGQRVYYPPHVVQTLEGERIVVERILALVEVGEQTSRSKNTAISTEPIEQEKYNDE